MSSSDEAGWGTPGEFLPTMFVLVVFTLAWGWVQQADGSPWIGLVVTPPLAAGMLSAALVRMILGRSTGGVAAVGSGGLFVFAMMFAMATVVSMQVASEFALNTTHVALSFVLGIVGSFMGAVALAHYVVQEQEELEEEEEEEEEEEDIDYSTEPEDLVCLLTNQIINRDLDDYVVCHNRFNVTQVCHAVYLKNYVHLLEDRCRRCFQPLRDRDRKGMRRR